MPHLKIVTAALLGLGLASAPAALAADDMSGHPSTGKTGVSDNRATGSMTGMSGDGKVIVVDAPDLRRAREGDIGPRFTSLIGEEVYSNSGKRLGEIEDFVVAGSGQMYAIVDTSDGPIEELVDMGDDEVILLSLRELRRGSPQAKPVR